jgi:hypothetical protein
MSRLGNYQITPEIIERTTFTSKKIWYYSIMEVFEIENRILEIINGLAAHSSSEQYTGELYKFNFSKTQVAMQFQGYHRQLLINLNAN